MRNRIQFGWLIWTLGWLISWVSEGAHAVPTQSEVYRNDELGVVVYKDSEDPAIFWYLPMVRLYKANDGSTQFRKRVNAEGNTQYTFFLVPEFSDAVAQFVANEIPGLQRRSQLKPVYAKKFAVQVPLFNMLAESQEVTDYRYLNQPQLVRLTLTPDQAADFEDLFSVQPGVPANVILYYESERVSKYLSIELTYKEVYNALNIGGTGRYTYTRAEIESGISNYLSNKYLHIRRKGEIQIPEIVNRVITECFVPSQRPSSGGRASTRAALAEALKQIEKFDNSENGYFTQIVGFDELQSLLQQIEQLQRVEGGVGIGEPKIVKTLGDNEEDIPPISPLPGPVVSPRTPLGPNPPSAPPTRPGVGPSVPTPPSSPGTSPTPGAPGRPVTSPAQPAGPELQFTFKRELANRDERFVYMEQEMLDSQEISVIPGFLAQNPNRSQVPQVRQLSHHTVIVKENATQRQPWPSRLRVERSQQYILSPAFSFFARSPHGVNEVNEYRWEAEWGNPFEHLYYRVGNGPWQRLGGRTTISAGSFQEGDIEFYIDRNALWKKIPGSLRNARMGGFVQAIFPFQGFLPEFHIRVSGYQVEHR
jgi:hypothetical protein